MSRLVRETGGPSPVVQLTPQGIEPVAAVAIVVVATIVVVPNGNYLVNLTRHAHSTAMGVALIPDEGPRRKASFLDLVGQQIIKNDEWASRWSCFGGSDNNKNRAPCRPHARAHRWNDDHNKMRGFCRSLREQRSSTPIEDSLPSAEGSGWIFLRSYVIIAIRQPGKQKQDASDRRHDANQHDLMPLSWEVVVVVLRSDLRWDMGKWHSSAS